MPPGEFALLRHNYSLNATNSILTNGFSSQLTLKELQKGLRLPAAQGGLLCRQYVSRNPLCSAFLLQLSHLSSFAHVVGSGKISLSGPSISPMPPSSQPPPRRQSVSAAPTPPRGPPPGIDRSAVSKGMYISFRCPIVESSL